MKLTKEQVRLYKECDNTQCCDCANDSDVNICAYIADNLIETLEDAWAKLERYESEIERYETEAMQIPDVCAYIEEYGACDKDKKFCPKICPKWELV